MARSAELLTPLYDLMVKRVLLSIVVHTDDTTVPVLDPTLPRTRTGRFWVYVGDVRNPYVVYDFTPRRTRDGPEHFLKGFRGYLLADAFSGYDRICAGSGVTEVACWAHVRRRFFESRTSAPVLAHAALARIRQLYKIEAAAEEFSAEDRRALRQRDSVPLLVAFGEWLTEQGHIVLPKSPIGQAVGYARSNWAALTRYLEAGYLAIDNNAAERALRPVAVSRKNWLFCGSDAGGRTAAVLFSVTATCKGLGIDPFVYLRDVLGRVATRRGGSGSCCPTTGGHSEGVRRPDEAGRHRGGHAVLWGWYALPTWPSPTSGGLGLSPRTDRRRFPSSRSPGAGTIRESISSAF
jgi:hypothetical protein